ncbi:putative quinol monooxygenase [Streptomyces griseoluteus]|uniref:putative quinol monooxygenase n=1 Tax=Streptomyces griseoluteus TaxID=29306 RepID=UPI0037F84522
MFREAVPEVHAERGCSRYSLHKKKESDGHFVMVEKWDSEQDLQAHREGAVMARVGKALGALGRPPGRGRPRSAPGRRTRQGCSLTNAQRGGEKLTISRPIGVYASAC